MKKVLDFEFFSASLMSGSAEKSLVKFINENKIEQSDILSISHKPNGSICLYYYKIEA